MGMGWFKDSKEDPDNNQGEYKPEVMKADIDKSIEDRFNSFREENKQALNPLLEMATSWREQRDREQNERNAAARVERQNDYEVTDEMYITNPREAIDRATKPFREQTQALAAITMRNEILGGREYYTGELKQQIDQLVESQPLSQRANAALLDNAYYTIVGRNNQAISEGKVKKQMSAATFNGNSNAPVDKESPENRVFDQEDQKYMKIFGLSAKDVAKAEQELGYV